MTTTPPKTKKKAAKAPTDPREALAGFARRMRKPRIESVGAELLAYVNETGPALVPIAEELGTLELAARYKLVELAEALIHIGVSPDAKRARTGGAPSPDGALANAFDNLENENDPAFERLLRLLLDAGANPDAVCSSYNGRAEVVLDAAVSRASRVGVRIIGERASETSKAHALCTIIARLVTYRSPAILTWIDELLGLWPVDGAGFDGISPLHAAAIAGDLALFARMQSQASVKVPRARDTVSWPLVMSLPPGASGAPSVLIPAGATPLFVARAVRAKCEQYLDVARALPASDPSRGPHISEQERRIAGHSAVIESLEQQGVVDDTAAAPLPPTLATVLAAATALAEHLGIRGFRERASAIDPIGKGPFGYFLACADLLRPALDTDGRQRLESSLVGKLVTGTVSQQVLVEDEEDPFEELGPDPATIRLRLDDYPEAARDLLERGKHYGVHGDRIVTLESSGGATKLWEIGREDVIEHGVIESWIARSVADMTARRES